MMEYSLSPFQRRSFAPSTRAPSSCFPMPVAESDIESDTLREFYERWMEHCKVCRTPDEKQKRFAEFKKNVEYIYSENKAGNYPYELQLNMYSDMTIEEYESKHPSVGRTNFKHLEIRDSDVVSDKSLARLYRLWMNRYGVSRSPNEKLKRFGIFKEQVKYIHSENKRDGILYRLGLNQFADITPEEFEEKEMGVPPSEMLTMYHKITDKDGVYHSRLWPNARPQKIVGCKMVASGDEDALEEAVNQQPVCSLFDARGNAFKNYRGGVLTAEYGKLLGFVATIFGYGVTPCGVKFWEIQNCFGPTWGEGGFLRMKRGVNLCGIASFVTYPVMTDI